MPNKSGISEQVLSLPKGGGDLKGLGEKFSPDPHTGTGTYSVPLALPSGRRGLTPPLTLAYSTGDGNGPFGVGWTAAPPCVSRRTDNGIPRHRDEEDTFLVSGWEDLVAVGGGEYRPRADTTFARIRHVTSATENHWVVIRPDGIRQVYGRTPDARIFDQGSGRARILSWLLSDTTDPCGNQIHYVYKSDRNPEPRLAINQTYLKAIYYAEYGSDPLGPASKRWLYRVLFDYGEGERPGWDLASDLADPALPPQIAALVAAAMPASTVRPDAFSTYRGGFEVRTRRRCWRISVQVRPEGEPAYQTTRSYLLRYTEAPYSRLSLLSGIQCVGFRPDEPDRAPVALPPLAFEYTRWDPTQRRYENITAPCDWLPEKGLEDPNFELIDLLGNGLPCVLHAAPTGYRYWRNVGRLRFGSPPIAMDSYPPGLALEDQGVQLADMEGNGSADLLVTQGTTPGFYRNRFDGQWSEFVAYEQAPSFDLEDPNVRLVDLNGDHIIDALLTGEDSFVYFPNRGRNGWAPPEVISRIRDLDEFPDVFFSAPDQRVRLGDMKGDGTQDLVAVYSGRVDYWPNLGHGRFGRRVSMKNAPRFDTSFDPARLHLTDINGDGCADLVYVDFDEVRVWVNQQGNAWNDAVVIGGTPITVPGSVRIADMNGTGTAGVLWSYPHSIERPDNYKYLDFTGGVKPHVLSRMHNSMGSRTTIRCEPSTVDYIRDWEQGRPWRTTLPFPVQVVRSVEHLDEVTGDRVVTEFRYHHGYFDGNEREYRGFGHVEEIDQRTGLAGDPEEPFPGVTHAWFHQGIPFALADEFHPSVPPLPNVVPRGSEAQRALRGRLLRSEVYGLDGRVEEGVPYLVSAEAFRVVPSGPVLAAERSEAANFHLERSTAAPRVTRSRFTYGPYGNVTRTDEIAEGRPGVAAGARAHEHDQGQTLHRAVVRTFAILDRADPGWTDPYVPGHIVDRMASEQRVPLSGGVDSRPDETRHYYDGDPFLGIGHPEAGSVPPGTAPVARGLLSGTLDLAYTPALEAAAWGADAAAISAEIDARGGYYVSPDGSRWTRLSRVRYGSDGLVEALRDARGGEQRIEYDVHRLFPIRVTDPGGFPTTVAYNLWAGAPREVVDANDGVTRYKYDALGRLQRVAYMGRRQASGEWEGDTLDVPSAEYAYDFDQVPALRRTLNREERGRADAAHETRTYFDGLGRVLEERIEAEPGPLDPNDSTSPHLAQRWIVTGKQIRNGKGAVRRSYQPFFSASGNYQPEPAALSSSFTRFEYDALGRLVRTVWPDGGLSILRLGAWQTEHLDPNDNGVRAASPAQNPEAARFTANYPAPPAAHVDTPRVEHFDALGRLVAVDEHNGFGPAGADRFVTRFRYDLRDVVVETYDARDDTTPAVRQTVDLLGRQILIEHVTAAGRHLAAHDAAGNHILEQCARGMRTTTTYDALQRPLEVRQNGVTREVYRYRSWDLTDVAAQRQHLFGPLETAFDPAGRQDFTYDLRGNVASLTRRIWKQADLIGVALDPAEWDGEILPDPVGASSATIQSRYLRPSDWSPDLAPMDDGFRLTYQYDSSSRLTSMEYPDGSALHITFGAGSLPETLTLQRGGGTEPLVTGVDYDVFGEPREMRFGNGVVSIYHRDPESRRLRELTTRRLAGRRYQHLRFQYDPIGNIQRIDDELQDPLIRDNQYIPNSRTYETDPLYRLVRATGRKRIESCPSPPRHGPSHVAPDEWPLSPHPADDMQMEPYVHLYEYGPTGTFRRNGDYGSQPIVYKADRPDLFAGDSGLAGAAETAGVGNYRYDADGNLVHAPHLNRLQWDADGTLALADMLGGGMARFAYDANGARVVKRVSRGPGTQKLTVYVLDKFELTLEQRPGLLGQVRWSAVNHVWFDGARLVMAERGTFADRVPLLFFHADQIGGSHVVTREDGSLFSQEEFLPFGRSSDRRRAKHRYRFAGKERDEETGLYYFGGRYYDPVAARFLSPDPIATYQPMLAASDPQTLNPYSYARNNPVIYTDSTGYILDTIVDVGFILYDVGALIYDEVANDGANRTENLVALGADAVGLLIPFATGAGLAARASIRGARALSHADDAARVLTHADDAARVVTHSDDAARAVTHADDAARATAHGDDAARAAAHSDDAARAASPPPAGGAGTPPPSRPTGGGGGSGPPPRRPQGAAGGEGGRPRPRRGGSRGQSHGSAARATARATMRRLGLEGVNLAGRSFNSGRKALERAGFRLERVTGTGRRVFTNPRTGAQVVYDSGGALVRGQRPHWHIFDSAGRQYDRLGRLVGASEGRAHIPAAR